MKAHEAGWIASHEPTRIRTEFKVNQRATVHAWRGPLGRSAEQAELKLRRVAVSGSFVVAQRAVIVGRGGLCGDAVEQSGVIVRTCDDGSVHVPP